MRLGYLGFALAVLGLYGAANLRGWELGSAQRDKIPERLRQSSGGYRSFVYWRGGK
jgi:hypothetical protein